MKYCPDGTTPPLSPVPSQTTVTPFPSEIVNCLGTVPEGVPLVGSNPDADNSNCLEFPGTGLLE